MDTSHSPESLTEIHFGQLYLRKPLDQYDHSTAEKCMWVVTDIGEEDYFFGARIMNSKIGEEKLSIESTEGIEDIELLTPEIWDKDRIFLDFAEHLIVTLLRS